MRQVEQLLVVRVRVDRRHPAAAQAEALVQHLGHRGQAVGGARGVGDDPVPRRVVLVVVDAEHQGQVGTLGRGADDHGLRARGEVLRGVVPLREQAGRLHHDVHAEVAPGKGRRVALGQHLEVARAHPQPAAFDRHLVGQVAEHRVVLEQVGQRLRIRDVVDRDELDILLAALQGGPHDVAADPSEPVDPHLDGHCSCPPRGACSRRFCCFDECDGRQSRRSTPRRGLPHGSKTNNCTDARGSRSNRLVHWGARHHCEMSVRRHLQHVAPRSPRSGH